MNPVEDLLQQVSLREPSDDLDRRVMASLQPEATQQLWKRVAFWSHIVTAAACLIIGVVVGQSQSSNNHENLRPISWLDRAPEPAKVLVPNSLVVPADTLEPLNPQTHFTEYRYRRCVACHQYTEPSTVSIDSSAQSDI